MGLVDELEHVVRAAQHADEAGRLLKHPPLPLEGGHLAAAREDPVGGFDAHAEETAHGSGLIAHRGVREREVRLLQPAAAVEHQAEIIHVDRLAGEDAGEQRIEDIPRLAPYFPQCVPPQCPGVLRPEDRGERIVVEPGLLAPPRHEHRLLGGEHQRHQRLEGLRPMPRLAKRRSLPVVRPYALAHVPAPGQEGR